jgi:hypothetical protein
MTTVFCNGAACGPATISCAAPGTAQSCICKALFHGLTCEQHFNSDNPPLFFSFHSLSLIAFLGLSVLGVGLLIYWYLRVVPAQEKATKLTAEKQRNPQLYGMVLVTVASLLRFANAITLLAAGPDIEANFYLTPTFTQWFARFTFGFFYPLVFGGYTLQVLVWIDMLIKIKRMQLTSPRWVWISFFVWLIVLSVFEITIELLLLFNVDAVAVVRAYRIILAFFILSLLIMVTVFAVRFFYVMRGVAPPVSPGSEVRRRSRANLTRLVLISAALLFCAFIAAVTIALVPPVDAGSYFGVQYTVLLFDTAGDLRRDVAYVFWLIVSFSSGVSLPVHFLGHAAQQAAAARERPQHGRPRHGARTAADGPGPRRHNRGRRHRPRPVIA